MCLGGLHCPCDEFSRNSLSLLERMLESRVLTGGSSAALTLYNLPIGAVFASCGAAQNLCKARYLVDPASSHMLVSKIKPCMSKYKPN